MDGVEVLTRIKSGGMMKIIPAVMLTSSREERGLRICYCAGASAYMVKPVDFNELMEAPGPAVKFWCGVNGTTTRVKSPEEP